METSYLTLFVFSSRDCGGDEGNARKRRKRIGSSESGPLLPRGHHQGNWIRHFSNPTPKTLVWMFERSRGGRIFIPKRLPFDNQIMAFSCRLDRGKCRKSTTCSTIRPAARRLKFQRDCIDRLLPLSKMFDFAELTVKSIAITALRAVHCSPEMTVTKILINRRVGPPFPLYYIRDTIRLRG